MEPIVNGLEDQFSDNVFFVRLNARDGADGEALFGELALPGHPSYVIYDVNQQETYRAVGLIDESTLYNEIQNTVIVIE